MTVREEIINLLLTTAQRRKENEEEYESLMEAIQAVKKIGCGNKCMWYLDGKCTKHFPNEPRNPFFICKDYERDVWDGYRTEKTG